MAATQLTNRLAAAQAAQERGEALEQRGAPSSVLGFVTNDRSRRELSRLLGTEEMADRWLRIALTLCRTTPDLLECNMESFAGALMQCAMLKLEPGQPLGLSWILPYENSVKVGGAWTKRKDAQFQAGYPGVIQLAMRSGQLSGIMAKEVCEGDEFDFDYLTGERHHKVPKRGERGQAYGFYCFAKYANGGEHFLYMTREQVEAHAKQFSRAYQYDLKRIAEGRKPSSPWLKDNGATFNAMACKTTIMQSRRYLPASPDFIRMLVADDQVSYLRNGKVVLDEDDFSLDLAATTPMIEGRAEEADETTGEKREPTPEEVAQGDLLKGQS